MAPKELGSSKKTMDQMWQEFGRWLRAEDVEGSREGGAQAKTRASREKSLRDRFDPSARPARSGTRSTDRPAPAKSSKPSKPSIIGNKGTGSISSTGMGSISKKGKGSIGNKGTGSMVGNKGTGSMIGNKKKK